MGFNSKAFLADRERLLEPESVLRKGSRRCWHEIAKELVMQKPDDRTEKQIQDAEDEFLKLHKVI